jgi:hypothetical protein
LYLDPQKLADMHWSDIFWLGYGAYPAYPWANIDQDITTAEEAIKQEPEPQKSRWESVQDWMSRKGEEQHGEDVPALLAQLQEVGWCVDEDLKTEV